MLKILSENIKLILIGMIAVLMIISAAIVISLYFGGDVMRRPSIVDISGSAHVIRDGKQFNADKNIKIHSGDLISTDSNGSLRISIDGDKYIFAEPNTVLYIYFTDVAFKGDISVNLSKGAVICQLNNKLKKNSTFMLKTPNGTVDVKGTVFRTAFDLLGDYMGYSNVMITEVQNFDGDISLQLYDKEQQPFDLPMVLVERTCAQMLTGDDICRYGYLNYDIDLRSLNENTLKEVLRASNEKGIAYSTDEVNAAFISVQNINRMKETSVYSDTETTAETSVTEISETDEETTNDTAGTFTSVPTETTSSSYSGTTLETHVYTTNSGVKWWEITGIADTGENADDGDNGGYDEFLNFFGENGTTVTAGTSAEP